MYEYPVLDTVSSAYPREEGRLLTCYSPVRHSPPPSKLKSSPFDLHVLSTPPAFVLSQDQTLRTKTNSENPNQPNHHTAARPARTIPTKKPNKQTRHQKANTLSSSQTTPTHRSALTGFIRGDRAMFPGPQGPCRSAQRGILYAGRAEGSNPGRVSVDTGPPTRPPTPYQAPIPSLSSARRPPERGCRWSADRAPPGARRARPPAAPARRRRRG